RGERCCAQLPTSPAGRGTLRKTQSGTGTCAWRVGRSSLGLVLRKSKTPKGAEVSQRRFSKEEDKAFLGVLRELCGESLEFLSPKSFTTHLDYFSASPASISFNTALQRSQTVGYLASSPTWIE